jgi:hypothetical protein
MQFWNGLQHAGVQRRHDSDRGRGCDDASRDDVDGALLDRFDADHYGRRPVRR